MADNDSLKSRILTGYQLRVTACNQSASNQNNSIAHSYWHSLALTNVYEFFLTCRAIRNTHACRLHMCSMPIIGTV